MDESGEKTWQRRVVSGEKREPRVLDEDQTQNDVILGWSFIFSKMKTLKLRCFEVYLFILKKISPKQCCFLCMTPKPYKTPYFSRISL